MTSLAVKMEQQNVSYSPASPSSFTAALGAVIEASKWPLHTNCSAPAQTSIAVVPWGLSNAAQLKLTKLLQRVATHLYCATLASSLSFYHAIQVLPYLRLHDPHRPANARPPPRSALAGSLAALAGLLGKLGADGDSSALQLLDAQCQSSRLSASCGLLAAVARLLSLALMLGVNGLMIGCFVKGLHETDSLTATVTSAAVSCVLSAAGGFVFFQELLPARWFVGAAVILVGMAFLLHGDAADQKAKQE
ncbi:unnamed protein product [Phytophthora lilii]|uniref:Unnamed protein product n=1 Tax=Phytophthora lilii TaxID=2077276 RepID=A0A9W6WW21_9STRA|nr:unnamed protein product [Phytophthora lilii]